MNWMTPLNRWAQAAPLVALAALALPARADVSVSGGNAGALERATQTGAANRNGSAASFGSATDDDRRLFKLRWRIPFYTAGNEATGLLAPLGAINTATSIPGVTMVNETLEQAATYIPQFELGEENKFFRIQGGVLSSGISHGTIVDGFTNSPTGTQRKFGLLGEFNLAGLGALAMVGNVLDPGSTVAGRLYGRPLMWFLAPDATFEPNEVDLDPRTEILGIWVTGLTFAMDARAPMSIAGNAEAPSSVIAAGWENRAALLDNNWLKAIGYLDLNMMNGLRDTAGEIGMGGAVHPGIELMADIAFVRLDLDAEYNFSSSRYVPRYFDRLYAVEREALYGQEGLSKAGSVAPASHGYKLRASAGLFEWLTIFLEAQDQFPFDPSEGNNSARFALGASGWLLFFGGNIFVSQAGIDTYSAPGITGPGFLMVAEGRVALLANVLHIIARHYRVHQPIAGESGYNLESGTLIGMEVNLDIF